MKLTIILLICLLASVALLKKNCPTKCACRGGVTHCERRRDVSLVLGKWRMEHLMLRGATIASVECVAGRFANSFVSVDVRGARPFKAACSVLECGNAATVAMQNESCSHPPLSKTTTLLTTPPSETVRSEGNMKWGVRLVVGCVLTLISSVVGSVCTALGLYNKNWRRWWRRKVAPFRRCCCPRAIRADGTRKQLKSIGILIPNRTYETDSEDEEQDVHYNHTIGRVDLERCTRGLKPRVHSRLH